MELAVLLEKMLLPRKRTREWRLLYVSVVVVVAVGLKL